jgi:hypothetical protein
MPDLFSREMTGALSRPVVKASSVEGYGARRRRYRATITLATQTTSDNILLAILPAGSIYEVSSITSSVSLGTAVVAIGTSKVHASNGQLRAAAVFTAVDTPTNFGLASALSAGPLANDTPIYLTIATASLPASGTLVIDLNVSNG